MPDEKLEFLIQWKDDLTAKLDALRSGPISRFRNEIGSLNMDLAGLGSAVLGAVGRLAELNQSFSQPLHQLEKASQSTGIAAKNLRNIAKEAGLSPDAFQTSLLRPQPALGNLSTSVLRAFVSLQDTPRQTANLPKTSLSLLQGMVSPVLQEGRASPTGIVDLLKALGLAGLRAVFGGIGAAMLGGTRERLGESTTGPGRRDPRDAASLDRLRGTAFDLNLLAQAARQLQEAAGQLGDGTLAQRGAAGQLKEAANALKQAVRATAPGDTGPAGEPFIMNALGGRGFSPAALALNALPFLGRALRGPARSLVGAVASGVITGARIGAASGHSLLGGLAGGGLAAAGVLAGIGISKLIGGLVHHGPDPAQRAAEIETILQANRYVEPSIISRELAFGGGEADYSFGSLPRVVVNVSAMDARSFQERSADIARAVRRELIEGMHPINMALREAF